MNIQVGSSGKMRELEVWGVFGVQVIADIMVLTEVF